MYLTTQYWAVQIIVGILGLIVGSFLNVVVLRLHTHRISKGRSKCLRCGHTLKSMDLIPVLSFVMLGGRCRYCHTKLSWQYPIVEAVTAVSFLLILCKIQTQMGIFTTLGILHFVFYAFIFSLLIVMAAYDIRHYILPWKLMKIFLIASFVFPVVIGFLTSGVSIENFVAGFIAAFPFWVLWYFSKGRLIGFGDIELMCGFGFLLGISGGFAAILLSFWAGAIFVFLKTIFTGKAMRGKSQIQFGPFLVLGSFVAFLFSIDISTFIATLLN